MDFRRNAHKVITKLLNICSHVERALTFAFVHLILTVYLKFTLNHLRAQTYFIFFINS